MKKRQEVATSTLHQKRSRDQPAKKSRSRHQSEVVTSVDMKGGRDIIQQSRHHEQKRRGRDNVQRSRHQLRRLEVVTPLSSRDNKSKERRSRHQSVVTTSNAKEARSRHHPVVATSVSKEEWSRHHSEVATSAAQTRRLRHHIVVATSNTKS